MQIVSKQTYSLIECFTLCNEFPLKVLILQSSEIRQNVTFHKVEKNDCLKLQPHVRNESSFLSERKGVGVETGSQFDTHIKFFVLYIFKWVRKTVRCVADAPSAIW